MAPRLVLFPLPLKGHINPMLQLASMLHSKGFSISIICTHFNSPDPSKHPEFTFHTIVDGLSKSEASLENDTTFFTALNEKCKEPFKECLSHLVSNGVSSSEKETVTCVIVDAFWHFARAVAHSLNLRVFVLSTLSIFSLHILLTFHRTEDYLSMQDKEIVVPEVSPLRIKDLPTMNMQDPTQHNELIHNIRREIKSSNGIIANSFMELEGPILAKLEKGLEIPIFPCGPFPLFQRWLSSANASPLASEHDKCMSWLDKQPANSVLYISLGTVVSIDKSELVELAWGIANSNRPFLLVVRSGLVHDTSDQSLPDGFRANEKGLTVSWAPQQEVLCHPSVGGFLTHSGWNSTIESIYAGVPMICVPFLADQMGIARYVSEVWKIGLYFEGRIDRSSIQQAITRVMANKEGGEMRENIAYLKNKVEQCYEVGGSSYKSLENLVNYVCSSSSI